MSETIETEPATTEAEPEARVDPYAAVIENDGSPLAPRLSAAWEGILSLLADGERHTFPELMDASGDLAAGTVRQLLKAAIDADRVQVIYDGRAARRSGTGREARKYRLIQ